MKILVVHRRRAFEARGRFHVLECKTCEDMKLSYYDLRMDRAKIGKQYDWLLVDKSEKLAINPDWCYLPAGRYWAVFHEVQVKPTGRGYPVKLDNQLGVVVIGEESSYIPPIRPTECPKCYVRRLKEQGTRVGECLYIQRVKKGRMSLDSPGVEVSDRIGPHPLEGCQVLVRKPFATIYVPEKGKVVVGDVVYELEEGAYDAYHEEACSSVPGKEAEKEERRVAKD